MPRLTWQHIGVPYASVFRFLPQSAQDTINTSTVIAEDTDNPGSGTCRCRYITPNPDQVEQCAILNVISLGFDLYHQNQGDGIYTYTIEGVQTPSGAVYDTKVVSFEILNGQIHWPKV